MSIKFPQEEWTENGKRTQTLSGMRPKEMRLIEVRSDSVPLLEVFSPHVLSHFHNFSSHIAPQYLVRRTRNGVECSTHSEVSVIESHGMNLDEYLMRFRRGDRCPAFGNSVKATTSLREDEGGVSTLRHERDLVMGVS